jgi:hypothetical protein
MSLAAKNRPLISDMTRAKLSAISKARKYPPRSEEYCTRQAETHRGKICSVETRIKMSQSHLARREAVNQ